MANIKNMRMGDTICADARVSITKGLLGLTTKYMYKPTGSTLKGVVMELGDNQGRRLRGIIEGTGALAKMLTDFRLKEADFGPYLLEAVRSLDGKFVALYLLHYEILNYEPVAPVRIFEGEEAQVLSQIF